MTIITKPTLGPWKSTDRALKSSNFGNYTCRITGPRVRDTFPLIAQVYGGIKDEREVAQVDAAHIVLCVNTFPILVEALEETARIFLRNKEGIPKFIEEALAQAQKQIP